MAFVPSSVTFSPDGQTLASGSFDRAVKLWNLSTQNCIQTLLGHNHSVRSVAFNGAGSLLASREFRMQNSEFKKEEI